MSAYSQSDREIYDAWALLRHMCPFIAVIIGLPSSKGSSKNYEN